MAQEWHRRVYDQIPLPVNYYAGETRDSDPEYPELYGYEVSVGPSHGLLSQFVPDALATFERQAQSAVEILDGVIAAGAKPARNAEGHAVLTLCAFVHGEWVRIHPFANGNGRTARLWANWAALRYGLPPFVTIRPRPPGDPYGAAAMHSMRGDHRTMAVVFNQMLRDRLSRGGP
jgi:fido (protein-threonine AMPylation protein)